MLVVLVFFGYIASGFTQYPSIMAHFFQEKISIRESSSLGFTSAVLGMVGAVFVSWGCNGNIGWALFHGLLNWFYLLYWLIFKDCATPDILQGWGLQ